MSTGKSPDGLLINAKRLIIGTVRAMFSGAERFGKRTLISGKVQFALDGKTVIGDEFLADGSLAAISIRTRKGGALSIGDHVYLNYGVSIDAWHDVRIGNNVMLGPFVSIIDNDRHEVEPGTALQKGPVIIGNNVWLGRNVAVMPGASIGNGSVIGANSVVTKDIPANSFAAGVPARVVRELNIPDGWVRH
jgi:acetyltransferase-like isoleucine patch superfamily enzyme